MRNRVLRVDGLDAQPRSEVRAKENNRGDVNHRLTLIDGLCLFLTKAQTVHRFLNLTRFHVERKFDRPKRR